MCKSQSTQVEAAEMRRDGTSNSKWWYFSQWGVARNAKANLFLFPTMYQSSWDQVFSLHANGMRETATTAAQSDHVSLAIQGSVSSNNSAGSPYAERPMETMCCMSQWWSSCSMALTGPGEHTSLTQLCCQEMLLSHSLSPSFLEEGRRGGKNFWQWVNCVC